MIENNNNAGLHASDNVYECICGAYLQNIVLIALNTLPSYFPHCLKQYLLQ